MDADRPPKRRPAMVLGGLEQIGDHCACRLPTAGRSLTLSPQHHPKPPPVLRRRSYPWRRMAAQRQQGAQLEPHQLLHGPAAGGWPVQKAQGARLSSACRSGCHPGTRRRPQAMGHARRQSDSRPAAVPDCCRRFGRAHPGTYSSWAWPPGSRSRKAAEVRYAGWLHQYSRPAGGCPTQALLTQRSQGPPATARRLEKNRGSGSRPRWNDKNPNPSWGPAPRSARPRQGLDFKLTDQLTLHASHHYSSLQDVYLKRDLLQHSMIDPIGDQRPRFTAAPTAARPGPASTTKSLKRHVHLTPAAMPSARGLAAEWTATTRLPTWRQPSGQLRPGQRPPAPRVISQRLR